MTDDPTNPTLDSSAQGALSASSSESNERRRVNLMSATPETNYDALAAWAESDEPTVQSGTKMVRGTPEGHAALRAMIEAGAETP